MARQYAAGSKPLQGSPGNPVHDTERGDARAQSSSKRRRRQFAPYYLRSAIDSMRDPDDKRSVYLLLAILVACGILFIINTSKSNAEAVSFAGKFPPPLLFNPQYSNFSNAVKPFCGAYLIYYPFYYAERDESLYFSCFLASSKELYQSSTGRSFATSIVLQSCDDRAQNPPYVCRSRLVFNRRSREHGSSDDAGTKHKC